MRRPRHRLAGEVLALYKGAPRGDRLHVRTRWWSCPFEEVERAVPPAGRVLEVGCGHGALTMLMARAEPDRQVTGSDIDRAKLAVARGAAAHMPASWRAEFVEPEGLSVPAGPWDAVVICDVLYLLGSARRRALLSECAASLAPGGCLVVKEIDSRPRWKHRLAVTQELVSTQVTRITEGDQVDFAPPTELVAEMERAGLEVTTERIDRGYPHPHLLLIGRRQ